MFRPGVAAKGDVLKSYLPMDAIFVELHLGLQKIFSRILTTLEHKAMIVTNVNPVFPLKNCVLVSTKVA